MPIINFIVIHERIMGKEEQSKMKSSSERVARNNQPNVHIIIIDLAVQHISVSWRGVAAISCRIYGLTLIRCKPPQRCLTEQSVCIRRINKCMRYYVILRWERAVRSNCCQYSLAEPHSRARGPPANSCMHNLHFVFLLLFCFSAVSMGSFSPRTVQCSLFANFYRIKIPVVFSILW